MDNTPHLHLEDNSGGHHLLTGSIHTLHPPMQDPRLGSYLARWSLLSPHSRITEAIFLHLVPMVTLHLGFHISLLRRPRHSRRIDQHICLPDLLGPSLLEQEGVVGRGTIDKLPANQPTMQTED